MRGQSAEGSEKTEEISKHSGVGCPLSTSRLLGREGQRKCSVALGKAAAAAACAFAFAFATCSCCMQAERLAACADDGAGGPFFAAVVRYEELDLYKVRGGTRLIVARRLLCRPTPV